jgi:hypothetical protein
VACVSVCASVRVELVCGSDDDGVGSGVVVVVVAVASLTVSAGVAMGSGVATGGPLTAGLQGLQSRARSAVDLSPSPQARAVVIFQGWATGVVAGAVLILGLEILLSSAA